MKASKTRKKLRLGIAPVLPAQCLYCDSDKGFETPVVTRELPFRDCMLEVSFEVTQCKACGESFLSEAQAQAQLKHTVAAFQQEAGLLTAGELIARRHALGLRSQQKLVDASSGAIAIATLKRIEAGQWVQDKTTDIAIRATLKALEHQQAEAAFQQICSQPMQSGLEVAIFQTPAASFHWSQGFYTRASSMTVNRSCMVWNADRANPQMWMDDADTDQDFARLVSC
jgi:hypothetical protein